MPECQTEPPHCPAASSISPLFFLLLELLKKEFLELSLPRVRRRQADVVLSDKRTDPRKRMPCTNVWAGLPTAVGLLFAVERMERGMRGGIWDAHWFKCFFCIGFATPPCS
jgi:hypothetical protein